MYTGGSMDITKCDICRKQIKNYEEEITIRAKLKRFSLCLNCGRSVILLLKKHKLLAKKEESSKKKIRV